MNRQRERSVEPRKGTDRPRNEKTAEVHPRRLRRTRPDHGRHRRDMLCQARPGNDAPENHRFPGQVRSSSEGGGVVMKKADRILKQARDLARSVETWADLANVLF